MDPFPCCLIPVTEVFSIMSPSVFRWLGARLLCCNGCWDISIPMHALQDFTSPAQAFSPLWQQLTHHAAWSTPTFSPAFLLLSLAHGHLAPACPIGVPAVCFISMSTEACLLPHSDMAFAEKGRCHSPSLLQPLKLCVLWSDFLRGVNKKQSWA